jgi:hypothetical protein
MPGPCDTPLPDDVQPADSTSTSAATSAAANVADFIAISLQRAGHRKGGSREPRVCAMRRRFGGAFIPCFLRIAAAAATPDQR